MTPEDCILGLGSNLGCRLSNLRRAVQALEQLSTIKIIAISPIYQSEAYLPNGAPTHFDQPFLNLALYGQTPLSPLALLNQVKVLEQTLGRTPGPTWSPRGIDIDILALGQHAYQSPRLTLPHAELLKRPFALNPLLDVRPTWRHPHFPDQPLTPLTNPYDQGGVIRTALRIKPPHCIGILNITPDSFSDGGEYEQIDQAIKKCAQFILDGAEIIDIGAESTRPGSEAISPEIEWQRLQPILAAICQWRTQTPQLFSPKISIDSRHATTFEKALDYPIDWLNDVDGKDYQAICAMIRGSDKRYIIMHHCGLPPKRHQVVAGDVLNTLYQFAEQRIDQLQQLGLQRQQLIFDIGIGFGKTPEHTRQLFNNMAIFKRLNVELMVGHSRKSFIQQINPTTPRQRDLETALLSALLAHQPIDYLRLHQVSDTQRARRLIDWYTHHD